MPNNDSSTIEARIVSNKHFANHLRTKLLQRACPAVREMLGRLSDAELIEIHFRNEQQGREHAAKLRAKKAVNE